ncbi:MAG: hypothetical protein ACP5FU_06000 [Nitrososphaeria archaeon]
MYDILRKSSVRSILKDLVSGYIIEYKVSFPKKDVMYLVDDKILDDKTLQLLLENNIITSAGNESLAVCPKCGSFNLHVILICPIHKASLQKIEIYEDKTNGNIIQGSFLTVTQNLVRRGYFFKCEKGETVINPAFVFRCENGHTFNLEEAVIINVKKYKVNEDALKQLKNYFDELQAASDYLSGKGYSIDEERKVKGLSGVEYEFDIKAISENQQLVFYFINGDKIEEFLSLLPKLYDLSQTNNLSLNVFVVTGKQVNEDLLHMFDRYNVKVVKAESAQELLDYLTKNLK